MRRVRSLAILAFIAGVAALAIYVARRPTLAHGSVLAAELLEQNKGKLRSLVCDDRVPIGVDGARFTCNAVFVDGSQGSVVFRMLRSGKINPEP
jgi:hypothetical protein